MNENIQSEGVRSIDAERLITLFLAEQPSWKQERNGSMS